MSHIAQHLRMQPASTEWGSRSHDTEITGQHSQAVEKAQIKKYTKEHLSHLRMNGTVTRGIWHTRQHWNGLKSQRRSLQVWQASFPAFLPPTSSCYVQPEKAQARTSLNGTLPLSHIISTQPVQVSHCFLLSASMEVVTVTVTALATRRELIITAFFPILQHHQTTSNRSQHHR